jgi:hypothetical protein
MYGVSLTYSSGTLRVTDAGMSFLRHRSESRNQILYNSAMADSRHCGWLPKNRNIEMSSWKSFELIPLWIVHSLQSSGDRNAVRVMVWGASIVFPCWLILCLTTRMGGT